MSSWLPDSEPHLVPLRGVQTVAQMIRFTVHGTPAPQGSKVRTQWGMREANPATRPWRAAVAAEAANVALLEPLAGPIELTALFFFARPKSHYRTGRNAGQLKDNAPTWCTSKPDTDKLIRAIGDAITGIVVRDDSQVVLLAARKLYGLPRVEVTIREVA